MLPERPNIEWYKTLQGSDLDPFIIQSSCIDTNSNLYISGKFRDTLKIEDQDPNVSAFPEMISSALIKITASGEIEFLKIFEDVENDMWIYTSACDENNNLYIWISAENEQKNQLHLCLTSLQSPTNKTFSLLIYFLFKHVLRLSHFFIDNHYRILS